ncbi:MAG: helix-turn-helix domain-containing protein [Deltaproteobacteria bacterium]|nr:helix-turn-helix domain-containing protein [Deltaproteobacteria bacterium]
MNQQGLQGNQQRIEHPMLLSIKQASEVSGLSVWAVRQRIWRGQLPFVSFERGGKQYVDRKDLQKMIERHKETLH